MLNVCLLCRIEARERNELMYRVVRIGGRIRLRGLGVLHELFEAKNISKRGRVGIEQLV